MRTPHPRLRTLVLAALVTGTVAASAVAQTTLFRDVRIFNGVDEELARGHVLVADGHIAEIATAPIQPPDGARVIEGAGRILSPGFIDLHAHLTFQMPRDQMNVHPWVTGAIAGRAAEFYLHNGFTTVRDAGGTHPDIARAIERGILVGPRVYPSGAVVSQTSGHGDFRARHDPHPVLSGRATDALLGSGLAIIADGVAQTLAAVRENLKNGATQVKIMGGGGVASDYDPIHTLQPSPEEVRAAVQAAGDWGTYILAHSYTAPAIRRLVENGVKVIEHGLLIDDETAALVAEKEVVISTQVKVFRMGAELPGMSEENRRKMAQVRAGQDNLMALIKKHGIKTGFGTDLVFGTYPMIGDEFVLRGEYFTPFEVMRQATSESAEVVRLAGPLNRHGNFGEIREGWVADLLLLEGDPFADLEVLRRPAEALAVIMKAGRIVKSEG